MSYARALDELLRAKNLEIRESNGYWFPSQLGGCDRQNILAHTGVTPNPKLASELRNLWLGDQIHKALQSNVPFEMLGSEKTARCRSEEYKLSGKLDFLVRNTSGEVEAVEFKSVLEKKFNYELPMPEHIMQVGCYLTFPIVCLHGAEDNFEFPRYCDHNIDSPYVHPQPDVAHIVYWAKENADMREFFIYPSDELEKKVKDELVRLETIYQDYLKTKELPEALPETNWRYRNRAGRIYCDFVGKGCCFDSAQVRGKRGVVHEDSRPKS